MTRPLSVTIIAFLILAAAALSLVCFPVMLADPAKFMALAQARGSYFIHIVLAVLGTMVTLAAGVGLLKGANWARYLYITWGALGLLQLFALFQLGPPQIFLFIIGAIKYGIFVYFLMRADADAYFRGATQA